MGASGAQSTGYEIEQSIRFNDGDSAYMHRTPSGAGNRRTFTYSLWFKLGDMATSQRMLLSVRNSDTTRDNIIFNQGSSGDFRIYFDARVSGSAHTQLEPARAFRDPAAWYHLIVAVDTTSETEANRVKFYINGIQETNFSTTNYPGLNQQFQVNNTDKHSIGRFEYSSVSGYWDGYLAEIHLIDGYAYGPEYFGEFNSSNIWIPKEYTESYGTNGFKIDGRDSSDLGDDESGNGNDFTTSGLAAHDQVLDSPTNNFNTLNALYETHAMTLSEGNLEGEGSNATYRRINGTQSVTSGKWYFEGYIVKTTVNNPTFGWVLTEPEDWDNYVQPGSGAHEAAVMAAATGQTHVGKVYVNANLSSSYTSTTAAGDIFGIAIDFDNLGFYVHKNGTYYNSGDPTSGSSKTGSLDASGLEANEYTPALGCQDSNSAAFLNFGQDGTFGGAITAGGNKDANGIGNFKYAVPSGYLALCTKNLGS